jgi:Flp pilus assembly protein protease CpaA
MLPAKDCERERVPYGIAIAIGCFVTVLCEFAMNWGR